jgi:hypothetical protein
VELAQAVSQVQIVRPHGVRADRDALDAPVAIEDSQPRGERLADFALGVVERAGDGGGRAGNGGGAQ